MALVQTVMWTAVPNGIDTATGKLKVRCLVSPRLSSSPEVNQTLGVYADWPAWTAKLAAAAFALSIQVGAVTHANLVPDKSVLKPNLWPALFPASMLVRPFKVSDFTTKRIRSYPVKNVVDAIKTLYAGQTNERPEDQGRPGRAWAGVPTIRGIQMPRNSERTFHTTVDNLYRSPTGVPIYAVPPGAPQPLTDFLQVQRFHWTPGNALPVEPRPFADTTLDFHQVVSLLMEYPILQRHLGLVLDFLVPVTGLVPGDTTVKILPPGPGHLTPTTAATYGTGYFWPKASGDVINNRLALAGANFSVVTIDVDGTAIKLRQFADNMLTVQDTDDQFLPSLRSAGLAVARIGKASLLHGKFGKAKQDNVTIVGGGNVVLDAASLLHGLRWQAYDVLNGRWFSLCERDVRYHFLSLGNTPAAYVPGPDGKLREEGTVTAAATQRVNDGTDDFYLAEYLARWHGENLAAPRPGLSLLEPDDPGLADPNPGPQKSTDPQLNVKTWPAPAGLPVLRYGRDYRLRALASYVGGAGVEFQRGDTSNDFTTTTGVWRYARSEPVVPPEIVMCAPPTPGETATDVVIRTEHDSDPGLTKMNGRHLLPPKVAQLFAEQLGMLDTDTGFDPAIYSVLTQRADGQLTLPHYPAGTNLDVPWLPDIYARGVALGTLAKIDFGYQADSKNWQGIKGVQIRLAEGAGAPAPLPGGVNGLLLKVGKGDIVEIPLTSYLSASHLDNLQIWRWFKEITAGNPKYKKSATDPYGYYVDWAVAGLLWMLSPKQKLRLICAVRQPLTVPAYLSDFATVTNPGENQVVLRWKAAVSRKSTVSLDVRASWVAKSDVLTGSTWNTVDSPKSIDLGDIPVDPAGPEGTLDLATLPGGGVLADFHDTKAHLVTYRTRAKSRFAEYFTERVTKQVTPAGETPVVVNQRGVADGSEIVTSGFTTYTRGLHYVMNYDTGTLARTLGSPIAGPVTVEFLPSITRFHNFSVWVNARTRPAAPIPVQVLPTFGWQTEAPSNDPALPGAVLSRRSGNGLRIYFSPPWHSSGEDEKLGVVFASTPGILEHMRPFVTQWANDPVVVDGQLLVPVPQATHVLGSPPVSGLVTLPELPGVPAANKQVRVVQLQPQWDNDRQLYYSDIEFAAPGKAYRPFIRLALCRYQPHHIPGVEMSQVRLADFAQLAPDRWVSLAYPSANEVHVTVVGHTYLGTFSSNMRGGNVVVTVERRDPGIVDTELAWSVVGTTQMSPGVAWAADNNKTVWTGKVTLPAAHSSEFRLVIQESERFPGGERNVFTDVVPLS